MSTRERRSWWQDGVLGRLAAGGPDALPQSLPLLRAGNDGLGLDGVIVPSGSIGEETDLHARGGDLRLLVELPSDRDRDTLAAAARTYLDRGAAGISIEVGAETARPHARVTRLHGPRAPQESCPSESLRTALDAYGGRVLVVRRSEGGPSRGPAAAHLVLETVLARQHWRAGSIGDGIEETERAVAGDGWPGYALGAPRRGPFAIGTSVDDTLACAAALHLTLRGTPCIELGGELDLGANPARRSWYRRLIALRAREPALHRGGFRRLAQERNVLGYLREWEAERICVLLNLGRRARMGHLPTGFGWTVLLAVGHAEGRMLPGGAVRLPASGVLVARAGAPVSRSLGGAGQRRARAR